MVGEEQRAFRRKPPHHVLLNGQTVHTFLPDLVVWDKITVELKSLRRKLRDSEFVQILNYLKFREDRLGLLVNMGLERVDFQRFPYTTPDYQLKEDWNYWADKIEGDDRQTGHAIRDAVRTIFESHGTGYGEKVISKLILHEFRHRGIAVQETPKAIDTFEDEEVGESSLECLIVNRRVAVTFSALFNDNSFNISRGLSFMKSLGLQWGVAMDFGKIVLSINGLHLNV